MIATSLIVLAITVSVALSKLDNKQELIKKLKEAKLDKIKNIATATLLTGDTSIYQRGWETIYFYSNEGCSNDSIWFGYMENDECHASTVGGFVRVEYNMDNCDSAYAHYSNENCEGTPTHYTFIGSPPVPPLTCEQQPDSPAVFWKNSCQTNSNRLNDLPVNDDGYFWQLDKETPGPEADCSSFSDLDSIGTQYYNAKGCINFPLMALTGVDPSATAPSSFNFFLYGKNMIQTLHTGLDCTAAGRVGERYGVPLDACEYYPSRDSSSGTGDYSSFSIDLPPNKCLWDTGCASGNAMCEAGSTCVAFQYWSQCQEDTSANNPGSNPACFATNNGPHGGKRWGCSQSSACCNPSATCGSDQLCHLSCDSKD